MRCAYTFNTNAFVINIGAYTTNTILHLHKSLEKRYSKKQTTNICAYTNNIDAYTTNSNAGCRMHKSIPSCIDQMKTGADTMAYLIWIIPSWIRVHADRFVSQLIQFSFLAK